MNDAIVRTPTPAGRAAATQIAATVGKGLTATKLLPRFAGPDLGGVPPLGP